MARRKRVSSAGGGNDDEVNLTPMLDVVFILLIFFIVTAQFIKEPGPDVDRVGVDNHTAIKPLAILIAIDENSDIWIDKEIIDANEIGFKIRELREDNPNGKLVVQTDGDSEAKALVDLMDVIAETDGRNAINISIERN